MIMSKPIEAAEQGFHRRDSWPLDRRGVAVVLPSCRFGSGSAAGETPPVAGHDRVGDGLM